VPPTPSGGHGGVSPPPVTRGGGVLLVHQGDTFWAIARQVYGDPTLWPAIAHANHLPNPNLIRTGQTLVIPQLTLPEFGPPPRG
jgi:nucleoid-associated protein YgaU